MDYGAQYGMYNMMASMALMQMSMNNMRASQYPPFVRQYQR